MTSDSNGDTSKAPREPAAPDRPVAPGAAPAESSADGPDQASGSSGSQQAGSGQTGSGQTGSRQTGSRQTGSRQTGSDQTASSAAASAAESTKTTASGGTPTVPGSASGAQVPGRRDGAPATPPRPPPRRGGRLLGSLALLIALAALGGAGYLYYLLVYQAPEADLAARIDGLRSELGTVDQRFDTLARDQRQAIDELREQQAEQARARAETDKALRESLADVARQAPPSTGEWQRAEARYLLRIANHRLLMERDVAGALNLLQAADGVLRQLDDFGMHEVRARLADEIASLEGVEGTDVEGLFLRLEAAKNDLDALPLRVPEYLQADQEAEPAAEDAWSALQRQLDRFLRFRKLDGPVQPLLAPEEAVYLELNLRLMLERAQMAAMRGEQMMFEQSLDTALDWIDRYLDPDERPAQRLIEELESLREVNLEQPLPDISGSLSALQAVLRNPT